MKKSAISKETVRLLNLISAVRSLPSVSSLDALEEKVLIALATKWANGAAVTVMEMLVCFSDVSPSTVQRRLKQLKKKGFIALKEDENDNRTKYIQPTQFSIDFLNTMGKCMILALEKK